MNMKLTAIIADDEPKIVESLRSKLERHFSWITVSACAYQGKELLEAVERHRPDVLFLDIEMPGQQGLELLHVLRSRGNPVQVIIISAYQHPEYFRKAIHEGVASYLVKPILLSELSEAIAHVTARLSTTAAIPPAAGQKVVDLPIVQGRIVLSESQIVYVEAEGNYCRVFMAGGRSELVLESMKSLEARYAGTSLFRADRSHLVNADHVFKVSVQTRQCHFLEAASQPPVDLNETGVRNVLQQVSIREKRTSQV